MSRPTPGKRSRASLAALALAVLAAICLGTPAAADLLVTRDGSVIQTQGPWKVQGRLVVFKLPNGSLASMQLGEVDLDASRAAMERARAAAERPPEPAPPARTAVVVLTDADVSPAPPIDDALEATATEEAQPAAPTPAAERLVVRSWEEESGPDGVIITGELVNQSADVASNIRLGVLLYDRDGEALDTVLATVTSPVLQPGQRARFRADVEGVFDYSALRFEAESLGLATGSQEEGPAAAPGSEEEGPGDAG